MRHKLLIISPLLILASIYFTFQSDTSIAATNVVLPVEIITKYRPVVGSGEKKMQGGTASAWPGPDGKSIVRTLDDYLSGRSTYVTAAATKDSKGGEYTAKISIIDNKGLKQIISVPVVVHDTGSFFEIDKARPISNEMLTAKNPNGSWKYPLEVPVNLRKKFPDGMTIEQDRAVRSAKTDVAISTSKSDTDAKSLSGENFSSVQILELTPKNKIAIKAKERTRGLIANAGANSSGPSLTEPQQPITQQPKDPCVGGGGGTGCGGTTGTVTTSTSKSSGGGLGSGGTGTWETTPYCYKHMGSASSKELKTAMTCNAGFRCQPIACGDDTCWTSIPVADCGINNINCFSAVAMSGYGNCPPKESMPQDGPTAGCLNYKCKNKPNAIWDPQSKKCGCG